MKALHKRIALSVFLTVVTILVEHKLSEIDDETADTTPNPIGFH